MRRKVKIRLFELGMTIPELSRQIKIPVATLTGNVLNGVKPIDPRRRAKISKALGFTQAELWPHVED